MVKARGGGTDEILSTIFGVCFFAAFIEVVLSQFIGKLRKLITPVVTGTIITLMGLSLIKVAVTDMAGGFGAADLGAASNMGLAALVLRAPSWYSTASTTRSCAWVRSSSA